MTRRWLFADQLGPHFLDDPGQPVLLVVGVVLVLGRRDRRAAARVAVLGCAAVLAVTLYSRGLLAAGPLSGEVRPPLARHWGNVEPPGDVSSVAY